ncbi:MAG: hypothetical protein JXA57_02320 [Armatimonadetes bacterium]|nr:hypothetical protein [Armatimonadota bacterium]
MSGKKSAMKPPAQRSAPGGSDVHSESERVDRELAAAALLKRQRGERPTRQELAALRRIEKRKEEEDRWRHYSTVPKKHYLEMAGRQARTVNEQAVTYNLPIGGRTIDLAALIRALHDFLARNARKLAEDDLDPLMAGGSSQALEDYRRERAKIARLERLEREGRVVRVDEIRVGLQTISSHLRRAGEQIARQGHGEAHSILEEGLDASEEEIRARFGGGHEGGGGSTEENGLSPQEGTQEEK